MSGMRDVRRRCAAMWLQVVAAGVWCATTVPASAADFNMDVGVDGIRLGGQVSGPPVTAEQLRHRVVVLEFWGINCPPCIRSMPTLEELHRQLGPSGLVTIGAHAQGGTVAEIRKVVGELGVTFPIVENAQVEAGMDFNGIPHCMVFDHAGKCVYRGSPFDAHDAIVAAVRAAPAAVLEGRQLEKLAAVSGMLRDESGYANALRKAKGLVSSKDATTAEEATFVVEKLEARGRGMLEDSRGKKESDPLAAAALVQRCATAFKGTEIGIEAADLLREWKKDKEFQMLVKAGQQMEQLEALAHRVRSAVGGEPTAETAARLPPAVKKQFEELVKSVHRLAPGSRIVERADTLAEQFGIAVTAL
jgi:thiol-disulfide isomerase/thioredoxin